MTDSPAQHKLGRIKDKYDLTDLDETLRVRYRSGEDSLRSLAAYVNRQITAAFLEEHPYAPNYVYEVLGPDGDDVSTRERNDLRRRLRADGLDIDELTEDWVSHMAVRTYLQDDLDLDTARPSRTARDPEETLEKLRGLISRDERIVEEALKATESVDVEDISIHAEVYVLDDETGETTRVERYLRTIPADAEDEADSS